MLRDLRAGIRRDWRDRYRRRHWWRRLSCWDCTYLWPDRAGHDLHPWRHFRRAYQPPVTIGFWTARRFDARKVLPYVVSQCAGAFLASVTLRLLFPANVTLGATLPAGSPLQSFILELILTALLMFVILAVSTGAREKGITAGIVVGSVIGLEAMFPGPICGASMNPARSLGPGVVSLHLQSLWIYLLAPVIGAVVGVFACRCVREPGCC
jgi:aquaporin NIP